MNRIVYITHAARTYLRVGLLDVETDDVVYSFALFGGVVNEQMAGGRHHGIHVEPVKSDEQTVTLAGRFTFYESYESDYSRQIEPANVHLVHDFRHVNDRFVFLPNRYVSLRGHHVVDEPVARARRQHHHLGFFVGLNSAHKWISQSDFLTVQT